MLDQYADEVTEFVTAPNTRFQFGQLYGWLNGGDVLIVKADRQEPLVVLRMSLAVEIAKPVM